MRQKNLVTFIRLFLVLCNTYKTRKFMNQNLTFAECQLKSFAGLSSWWGLTVYAAYPEDLATLLVLNIFISDAFWEI